MNLGSCSEQKVVLGSMLSCCPSSTRRSCIFTMAPTLAWIPYCQLVFASLWRSPCFSFWYQLTDSIYVSMKETITILANYYRPYLRFLSYTPSYVITQPTKWPPLVWARPSTNSVSPRMGIVVWNTVMVNFMCKLDWVMGAWIFG